MERKKSDLNETSGVVKRLSYYFSLIDNRHGKFQFFETFKITFLGKNRIFLTENWRISCFFFRVWGRSEILADKCRILFCFARIIFFVKSIKSTLDQLELGFCLFKEKCENFINKIVLDCCVLNWFFFNFQKQNRNFQKEFSKISEFSAYYYVSIDRI